MLQRSGWWGLDTSSTATLWAPQTTSANALSFYSNTSAAVTTTNGQWLSTTYWDPFPGRRAGEMPDAYRLQQAALRVAPEALRRAQHGDERAFIDGVMREMDRELGIVRNEELARDFRAEESARAEQVSSARQRSKDLLLSCLNETQRGQLEMWNYFLCVSNLGNVFRIEQREAHGVIKLNAQAQAIEEWCVMPNGQFPVFDIMLSQKLALESDEMALEGRANVRCLATGRLRYRAAVQYNPYAADYQREAAE